MSSINFKMNPRPTEAVRDLTNTNMQRAKTIQLGCNKNIDQPVKVLNIIKNGSKLASISKRILFNTEHICSSK